jgi:Lhr-like helicase
MTEKINVTEVHFERAFNLGSYETFRIGLTATVGPKQTVEEIVAALDEQTVRLRNAHKKDRSN